MRLRVSDVLVPSAVTIEPVWGEFESAIAGMVEHLVAAGHVPPGLSAAVVRHVCEREAVASTAMVDIGVSIPHARLDGVTGVVAAMAVSRRAVYEVATGLPISIVTLVLSSPAVAGDYLTFLSHLSMLLQSARTRTLLRNAASVEDLLQVIRTIE